KTVLIVLAHQSPGSFNAAVCDVAVQELRLQGFRVLLSDLYAMKFRADATRDDIIGELKKPELFQYGDETMSAWKEDRLSNDIVAEQRKVEEADLIIFQVRGHVQQQSYRLYFSRVKSVGEGVDGCVQFPLYWFSVPAILKGWFDRVFTQGFAFSLENMYDNGVFKVSPALMEDVSVILGRRRDESVCSPAGQEGHAVLHHGGHPDHVPLTASTGTSTSPSGPYRMARCTSVDSRFLSADILVPGPLGARRTHRHAGWVEGAAEGADGGEAPGVRPRRPLPPQLPGRLSDEAGGEEAARGRAFGLTTGHHLGKPLPPDNQLKAP
ncbi:unnamed protein product, partial [Tetraodon nigroviridis]